MFLARQVLPDYARHVYHSCTRHYQVAVVGGANVLGQATCLLLRSHPRVKKLVIHDEESLSSGVALDLSHIPTVSKVTGYHGKQTLDTALAGSDIVIATGGTPQKPGLTKDKWFFINAEFVRELSIKVSRVQPLPFLGIVTEPINTLVPMAAELLRSHGDYDPKKLFGITTNEALRAQAAYAAHHKLTHCDCYVPVIGGRSAKTILPLLSQATPECEMCDSSIMELTHTIQKGHDQVTMAKKGWSPTLSTAYGIAEFVAAIMDALDGNKAKVNAFVENNDFGTSFFSGLVELNHDGAGEMERYNNMSSYEVSLLEKCIDQLRRDVEYGKKMLEWA